MEPYFVILCLLEFDFYVLLRTVNHTFTHFYALLRNFMYFCVLVCTQKIRDVIFAGKKLRERHKPQQTYKHRELQVFAPYPSVWTIFYTRFDENVARIQ